MELRGKLVQSLANLKSDLLFHFRDKDGAPSLWDAAGRDTVLRHARRSCHPNAQLKMHKPSQRLYLVALEVLERNQPVTLPHGSVTDGANTISRENCGKDCTYNPNLNMKHSPQRRTRLNTMSEESDREGESPLSPTDRKLTREEKKIEQAMKIFAQMEKDTARKRDRNPTSVIFRSRGDSDKESPNESGKQRRRRRRRKRRNSRKSRQSGSGPGSSQLHSGDDSDVSTGDEFPSPRGKHDSGREDDDDKILGMDDAAGLLIALGSARHNPTSGRRTPPPSSLEMDTSPSTPLSSTCLLVAAAVGQLAPGFKFPKTKKVGFFFFFKFLVLNSYFVLQGLMNEWLGKSPEPDLSPSTEMGPGSGHGDLPLPPGAPKLSNLSNRLYYPPRDNGTGFSEFGKKRWLRQAISEVTEPPLGMS